MTRTLPTDSNARKDVPVFRGCVAYFAAALAGVARWSKIGNDKHNPGEEMHHARGKSNDHADCIVRHLMDIADLEAYFERAQDGALLVSVNGEQSALVKAILDEADALGWRALARSQELHEKYAGAPLAPGAREPVKPYRPHENMVCVAAAKLADRRDLLTHGRKYPPRGVCECGDPACKWPEPSLSHPTEPC